jgi:putative membrane protein
MGLWMIVGGLFWLAALGLLIWALVRWLGSRSQTPPPGPSALEILRQRYARGEIDTATFEQLRERLEEDRTGSREPNDVRELSTPQR